MAQLGSPITARRKRGLVTLSEAAYTMLQERLVSLAIPPGAAFTEARLAAELHLSKTPVREALRHLQSDGLVEVSRGGYRAAPITLKDARDFLALRTLLDVEAARLAATQAAAGQLGEADRLRLEELAGVITYDNGDRTRVTEFLSVNTAFHVAVARAGQNERLAEILERVLVQYERIVHLGAQLGWAPGTLSQDHGGLTAAIGAGRVDEAVSIAREAARHGEQLVLESLLSSPSLQDTNLHFPSSAWAQSEPVEA